MSRNIGARAVSGTGSVTGVATVILALLSAGTVASISLVGAHQLARPATDRLRAGAPGEVRAPQRVVVTPHAAPTSSSEPVSHHHSAKPRSSSPSDATVVPAVLTSPTSTRARVPKPHVHVPSVDVAIPAIPAIPAVAIPAVAIPAVPTPPVPTPPVSTPLVPTLSQGPPVTAVPRPGYPDVTSTRTHRSRAVDAYSPLPATSAAVVENSDRSRRDGRVCTDQGRVGHRGEQRDGYGGDRGRANGPGPSSHGQHGQHGQHGH